MPHRLAALLLLIAVPLAGEDLSRDFAVAIERDDAAAVKMLLDRGASPDTNIVYGENYTTPLIKAAWDGAVGIVELLLEAGADVNATASDGGTALMSAVAREREGIVATLLEAGATLSLKNRYGFNAFTSAVAGGHLEIAGLLLDAGAEIEEGAHTLTPLQFAATAGNVEMIRLLASRGADVNRGAKNGDRTPIFFAIQGAKAEAVAALIELNANVNVRTRDGETPLKAAQKGDQDDLIALLKAAGAKE